MSCKQKRMILNIGNAVAVVLIAALFLLPQTYQPVAIAVTGIVFLAALIFWLAAMKCPHCGKHYSQLKPGQNTCPHCGKPLE